MRLLSAPVALLLAGAAVAAGGEGAAEPVAGELIAGRELVDPGFRVHAPALGLERRVEMLQWWQRDDGGYDARWSERSLDSAGHDRAHLNPPWPDFASERWINEHAVLNGREVDAALYAGLDGWSPLPVDPARLPANLAVVFQPDDAGLTSSAELAAPEVGDLRLRWFALHGGPVYGRAIERSGRWVAGDGTGLVRGAPAPDGSAGDIPGLGREPRLKTVWLLWIAGGFVLLLVALYLRRKN